MVVFEEAAMLCSKITAAPLNDLQRLYEVRTVSKAQTIFSFGPSTSFTC